MPAKSVRDMTFIERKSRSLEARTFHAILIISLVICIAAINFGFFMYQSAVKEQYRDRAYNLAKTGATVLDTDEVAAITREVVEIWRSLPEEERAAQDTAFKMRFASVMNGRYAELRAQLGELQDENGADALYLAVNDQENGAFIYVLDADPTENWCSPGTWEEMTPKIAANYVDDPVETPFFVSRTNYGYLGTSYCYLGTTDGYTAMVCADMPMGEVARTARAFLLQYGLVMLAVTVAVAVAAVQHLKKNVVRPVNELTAAAEGYIEDKKQGEFGHPHFRELQIRTGDELENLSLILGDMEKDLGEYVEDLTRVTAEKERIGAELDIASKIQEGMLPNIYPAFPDRPEFDIYATMTTAKEVGGDFYDFFLIDDDHLGVVMADVSGKGVPAALFMMASKILIKNFAMIEKTSPARILEMVNDAICKNNEVEMFVTTWLGILEISSGRLTAANAGHEYPCVRRAGGRYELLRDAHGFVVGGMEGVFYKDYELKLGSGDSIFLYTDGVPEATNGEAALFGTERMVAALNEEPESTPVETLAAVYRAVNAFVKDAPQFDDLTMLCLKIM